MNYTLVIQGSPIASQSCQTALGFARAALNQGHKILRVFFLGDAVHIASTLTVPPQGEQDLHSEWKALANAHGIDLVICISAAIKRGLVDQQEAQRYSKPAFNIEAPFTLSGLGQLVDAAVHADRVITFGS